MASWEIRLEVQHVNPLLNLKRFSWLIVLHPQSLHVKQWLAWLMESLENGWSAMW